MRYKSALRRSAVILAILSLSVIIGFLYQLIWDNIDRKNYPQSYSEYVEKYSEMYGVPEYIVYATIKVESGFSSNAVSSAGAVGLMQLMPDTFQYLMAENKEAYEPDLIYGPETNIRYGTWYLGYLSRRFDGDATKIVCAYHAGQGNVDSWLKNPQYSADGVTLDVIPTQDTATYASRVLRARDVYRKYYFPVETPEPTES